MQHATPYHWDKFDIDTGKQVVDSKSGSVGETDDADDEASPINLDSPCNMADIGGGRRRATRIFVAGRDRH